MRTLRVALFGTGDRGLINVRLHRNALSCRYSRRAETTANGIAPANSGSNFLGELLSIRSALCVRGFSRVGQEPAFHEHRRNGRLSQDVVTTPTDSPICRRRAAGNIMMNRRGERQAVATVKVCFDAARAASSCRIKMDTHKDSISIRVGDCHSPSQRDKYVAAPGHHDPITTG